MSRPSAWQTHRQYAATAARWTADRWSKESDRRRTLRATRKPLVRDARRALANARAMDPNGITTAVHTAERALATTKRSVPDPLWLFASKGVIVAAVGAYIGLPLVPGRVWAWSALAVTVAAVGTIVWAITHRPPAPDIEPTAEEKALMKRLQPEHWREHAEQRGLSGTLTARPTLTESGIVCAIRLDGTWTATKLRGAEDHVRSLLGARTDLRMQIKAGKKGGWADLTIRTRSAGDGIDLSGWEPGAPWGIDTVTGEPVMVPLGRRMLVAGASGSGKSWSTRAMLGEASEYADHRLVLFDMKRVEGLNWNHRARVGVTPDEILTISDELVAEMDDRLKLVPRGRDTIAISTTHPRITVFVDEGGELISAAKDKAYLRIMENLRTLARMGRAAEIIIIWATQKPTMSGEGHGIDSQVAAQITVRASLYLSTSGESMNVFGSDAIEKGWHAHELPEVGHALLRIGAKGKQHAIRTRAFSPTDVIALPARPIWTRATTASTATPATTLTLVKPPPPAAVPAPGPVAAPATGSVDDRVLTALRSGAARQADIVTATGLPKGTVSKAVKRLTLAGHINRTPDGALSTDRAA
ncbi:cell division protein FtsK [Streptomyces sp. SID8359]|uniref:MarR family transcriptional regulator n=1 Tax=unclassified Streptomyces TaxID=2593676 RepID=UPI00048C8E58|nr:helix-turn-helix domain-containing protein [Streptomyces sp. SolWspMP-sol2th]MYT90404.1 cell division protein FtsK [Streptomyces sp. SID8359]